MNPVLPIPWIVLLGGALVIFAGAWGWISAQGGTPVRRGTIAGLRALAAALLIIPALNPGDWRTESELREDLYLFLADESGSMDTQEGSASRWQQTVAELTEATTGMSHVDALSELRLFGDGLRTVSDPTRLPEQARAETSPLIQSVAALLDDAATSDQTLRGIVVWTDGISSEDPIQAERIGLTARARGIPIHVRHLGGEVKQPDLSLEVLEDHLTTFKGQEIRIPVRLTAAHLGPVKTDVILRNGKGEEKGRATVSLTPDADGIGRKRVWIDVGSADGKPEQLRAEVAVWKNEARTDNNAGTVWIEPIDHRLRILFVEGTPHWDSKFLMQLLRKQDHLDLTTVHRLSESRYYRVSPEAADEEGVEENEPFPVSGEGLRAYDLLILGKGMEYVLTPDRLEQVRTFVQQNDGMVLFARGKPYAGSFPELESLEPLVWGPEDRSPRRWRPEGASENTLFGGALPDRDDPVWAVVKPMAAVHEVTALRPFARTLATTVRADGAGDSSGIPGLVLRRIGGGVVATVNAEGVWAWDFFPEVESSRDLYRDLWLGLLQWGVSQSSFTPGTDVALRPLSDAPSLNRPWRVRVQTRDPEADAPKLSWWRDGQFVKEVTALPGSEPGTWESVLRFDEPGDYTLQAGEGDRRTVLPVRIAPPPSERDQLSADDTLPRILATLSGGTWFDNAPGTAFLPQEETTPDEIDRASATWVPAWSTWLLLLAATGIWLFEWSLRRRSGWL